MRAAFAAAHRARFGFDPGEAPLVIEAAGAEAVGGAADVAEPEVAEAGAASRRRRWWRRSGSAAAGSRRGSCGARRWRRGRGSPGRRCWSSRTPSILVEPGWQARITAHDHVELRRVVPRPEREAVGTRADPVMLEVFNNLYMSIAEQMGAVLENTAVSVTIKERLDFSCAVFDAAGDLIANAPHMPVHLGSMGASVKAIIAQNPGMAPGDVFVLNAPYNGGTHLPDITVVRPVWDEGGGRVLFFTAARGHHTDVGGLTPGSMPPDSRTIHDEGVYIDNWQLVAGGRFREAETRALLGSGDWPARSPEVNLADLRAQVAACEKGAQELMADGGAVRARGGRGLHAPRAGERRGVRAAGDRGACGTPRWSIRWTRTSTGSPREVRVKVTRRPGGAVGADRLHRARRRSSPPTTTRRSR